MKTLLQTQPALVISLQQNGANLVTAVRVALLFAVTGFAVSGNPALTMVALPLALIVIWMDWLDGVLARRYGSATTVGSVVDIVGDRIVENVWWITFAWLGLVPLWVPIVVVSRGFVTDGIRGYALARGKTAFGEKTMMRSRVGFWLVASRPSRGTYCVAKIVAFGLLFGLNALLTLPAAGDSAVHLLTGAAMAATYLTVVLCLVRGLPVVTEFRRLLREEQS